MHIFQLLLKNMCTVPPMPHQHPPHHQVSKKTVPQRLKPHVERDLRHG
jgi:hypothetical protein